MIGRLFRKKVYISNNAQIILVMFLTTAAFSAVSRNLESFTTIAVIFAECIPLCTISENKQRDIKRITETLKRGLILGIIPAVVLTIFTPLLKVSPAIPTIGYIKGAILLASFSTLLLHLNKKQMKIAGAMLILYSTIAVYTT